MKINASLFEEKKIIYSILLFSVLLSLIFHFFVERKAMVNLEVEASSRSLFKIYWKNQGGGWSERRVAAVMLEKGRHVYKFQLTDLGRVDALRIDPSEQVAPVTLYSLEITQNGYSPIRLDSPESWAQVKPLENIAEVRIAGQGVTVTPNTKDGQLLFELPAMTPASTLLDEAVHVIVIFLLVAGVAMATRRLHTGDDYVLYLVTMVFVLVLVMASISRFSEHPDEHVHVRAGEYFQSHYMPPPVGDASILDTYSVYGVSRLHSGEIVYLFAGQFSRLLKAFYLPSYLSLRMFNVSLLFILLLIAVHCIEFRSILLPLLLSPQIWYVFSYFNSEAFAVFVMILVAYQLVGSQSTLHRLLAGTLSPRQTLVAMLCLGLLLAGILLSKVNFYFFGLFIGLYFLWRMALGKTVLTKRSSLRLASLVLVGIAVFGAIRFADNATNDFKKSERLLEAREQYARDLYKPSTPLSQKHLYLQMRDRGISLKQFIQVDRWGEKSFRTAFGVYGHTTISASFAYYDYVRYTGLLLLLVGSGIIAFRGGWEGTSLLAICIVSAIGLVAVALYHAWTVDFQAQGRYFLPIVGMLSVLFFHTQRYLMRPLFVFLLLCMFCLSAYSFIFVGMCGVGKLGLGMV